MFILKSTQQRCNPYAPYTDQAGTRYPRMPAELYEEIPEPVAPDDYSQDTYYRTEQDDAPYVIYTRKSDEQIMAVMLAKYEQALDAHLDSVAQADRWSDRFTFSARAAYPNIWRDKATAFGTWMDECNAQAYVLMGAVIAGEAAAPSLEEFIAGLPEFVPPETM